MYICHDKCHREIPEEDHRDAQADDYLHYARFCALCRVVYDKSKPEIFAKLGPEFTCCCCEAKTRGYFEVEKERQQAVQKEIEKKQQNFAMTFYSGITLKEITDMVFRIKDWRKAEKKKKAKKLPKIQTQKKKKKLDMDIKHIKQMRLPLMVKEISMFPQQ